MPHTVSSLLAVANLTHAGVVKWGTQIPSCRNGIYIISTTADPDTPGMMIRECPLCMNEVRQWHERYGIGVDKKPATVFDIAARIAQHWLPMENVLYIGKTECRGGIRKRVRQFYDHILGESRPHKGGHWLKTLSIIGELFVHYAFSDRPVDDESTLIGHFCGRSPEKPWPFANQEWHCDGRKHRRNAGVGAVKAAAGGGLSEE